MKALKEALVSRTVWGAVLMAASMGLKMSGHDILDDATQTQIVEGGMSLVGFLLTLYGRYKASGPLGK